MTTDSLTGKLKEVKFRACAKPQNKAQVGLELMLALLCQPRHCWVIDRRNHTWLFILFTSCGTAFLSPDYHAADDFDFKFL